MRNIYKLIIFEKDIFLIKKKELTIKSEKSPGSKKIMREMKTSEVNMRAETLAAAGKRLRY